METNLKQLRNRSGLSQQAMADALGVKKLTYGAWERDEAEISLAQAVECARVLGCTLDEIAGYVPERNFSDPRQAELNACYENMNEAGRSTLATVAKSLEKDTANRLEKIGENDSDQAAEGVA